MKTRKKNASVCKKTVSNKFLFMRHLTSNNVLINGGGRINGPLQYFDDIFSDFQLIRLFLFLKTTRRVNLYKMVLFLLT